MIYTKICSVLEDNIKINRQIRFYVRYSFTMKISGKTTFTEKPTHLYQKLVSYVSDASRRLYKSWNQYIRALLASIL